MTRWFRLYDETLNDPKILKLSDKTHRVWIGILCVASKNNGSLPPVEDMAVMLRMKPVKLQPELEKLIAAGLIDHDDNGMRPHNWNGRQYKSDVSTERVKRFRNGQRNVSVTPPETEQNRTEEEPANAAPPPVPAKRKKQLPEGWKPNDTGRTLAIGAGLQPEVLLENFTDYHRARGSVMLDWDAAFRTWIKNQIRFAKERNGNARRTGSLAGIL